jgi:hypothetical protein
MLKIELYLIVHNTSFLARTRSLSDLLIFAPFRRKNLDYRGSLAAKAARGVCRVEFCDKSQNSLLKGLKPDKLLVDARKQFPVTSNARVATPTGIPLKKPFFAMFFLLGM